jgi:hypothetical protein
MGASCNRRLKNRDTEAVGFRPSAVADHRGKEQLTANSERWSRAVFRLAKVGILVLCSRHTFARFAADWTPVGRAPTEDEGHYQ